MWYTGRMGDSRLDETGAWAGLENMIVETSPVFEMSSRNLMRVIGGIWTWAYKEAAASKHARTIKDHTQGLFGLHQ